MATSCGPHSNGGNIGYSLRCCQPLGSQKLSSFSYDILPMCDPTRGWAHASVCCEIIGRNMHKNLQSPPFCNRINSSLLQALLAQAGLKTCGHGKLVAFGWRGAHVYVASLLGACGWDSMPFSCPNSRARASKLGGLCPFFVATRCFPKLLVHIFGREGIIT